MLTQQKLFKDYLEFIKGNSEGFLKEPQVFHKEFVESYFRVLAEETAFNHPIEYSFTQLITAFTLFSSVLLETSTAAFIVETVKQYFTFLAELEAL